MGKTTSLELSKKLEEAGAKQESESVTEGKLLDPVYASFNTDELLERLPALIGADPLALIKIAFGAEDKRTYEYQTSYASWTTEGVYTEDTPAEALGNLYLWCLENGHCNE